MTILYRKVHYSEQFGASVYVDDGRARVSAEVKETRQRLIGVLRDPRGDGWYREKLAACGPNKKSWCNLPICPCCVERTQRWLTKGVADCLLEIFSEHEVPIIGVHAELPGQRYERAGLYDIDVLSLNRQIENRYAKAGFPLAFSSVRVTLIEGDDVETAFWEAAVRSVIVGLPKRDVIRAMKRLYPKQSIERRPDWDAEETVRTLIEPGFFGETTRKETDGSTVTEVAELRGVELRRAAYCFARHKMPVRYVLTGCRPIGNGIELKRSVKEQLTAYTGRRRRGR